MSAPSRSKNHREQKGIQNINKREKLATVSTPEIDKIIDKSEATHIPDFPETIPTSLLEYEVDNLNSRYDV
ncbi:hypothetical protein HYFRA_00008491 [Hymenoscyphus fraxineus]|uniref:Uncharacterized protein n=1 Tax=Hymenoscyphus fraxineus TaxID=746836 RepID=A0A9N9KNL3_9HELO|nr:hypothetical protein HYFRA_00008491 [Hymenoscyphus fraxineus]